MHPAEELEIKTRGEEDGSTRKSIISATTSVLFNLGIIQRSEVLLPDLRPVHHRASGFTFEIDFKGFTASRCGTSSRTVWKCTQKLHDNAMALKALSTKFENYLNNGNPSVGTLQGASKIATTSEYMFGEDVAIAKTKFNGHWGCLTSRRWRRLSALHPCAR